MRTSYVIRFSNFSAPLSQASTTLSFRIYHLHGVLATSHRLGIVIDTDLGKLRSALQEIVNPYENAIFVIGKTLAPSDEHNFISCFGFFDCEFVSQNNFIFNFDSLCSFFIIIQLLPMARKCSVCTVTILQAMALKMSYHVTEDSHLTFFYQVFFFSLVTSLPSVPNNQDFE